MTFEKKISSFINPGREIRRAPLVGMDFLHERPMRLTDVIGTRPRLHPKDLVSFLLRHRVTARTASSLARPRCRVLIDVFTPSGKPAVEISFKH